jgi:citrate lyase gamma subunit
MNGFTSGWTGVLEYKAQLLHQQIAAMQRLVADTGASPERLAQACQPYYRLLDQLYGKDVPMARALDTADLLLHLEGEGLTANPRLSLVTSVMDDVRKQVGTMIKTLVSSLDEAVDLPREPLLVRPRQPLSRIHRAGTAARPHRAAGRSALRRLARSAFAFREGDRPHRGVRRLRTHLRRLCRSQDARRGAQRSGAIGTLGPARRLVRGHRRPGNA